jgi:hypothetical protein
LFFFVSVKRADGAFPVSSPVLVSGLFVATKLRYSSEMAKQMTQNHVERAVVLDFPESFL